MLFEDVNGCAYSIAVYANSRKEAEECVTAGGGRVVTSPTPTTMTFSTDPTYGCAEITLVAFSSASGRRCAAAAGYTRSGPCPR
ncbi:MAG: hypothetical protein KIS78_35910 [Labilithrix sp.]|nr:hypothetical protein [Labilithrix sp.]MCW5837833.1 hypothetical protein [Labilithrix sp.]